jgi:PatG C-terminal
MEQPEGKEQATNGNHTATTLRPRPGEAPCPTCGAGTGPQPDANEINTPPHIYALGRITPRFPRLSVEKEFAQVSGRTDTSGLTDRQVLHAVLSQRENRYLVRQLCWVLTIEGLETYLLHPRDPADFGLLVEALRPTPSPLDVDIVIGVRGPIAPPEMCNGLMVPIIVFDQIYSFDRDSFIQSIPRPEKMAAKQFESAAMELFERIQQIADNAGAIDDHRALNYCAVRYPAIYATAVDCHERNFSLTEVEVRPSRLSGARKVIDIIFSYTHRQTDVREKYFCRVDVSEEFPFLVTKILPYYDR